MQFQFAILTDPLESRVKNEIELILLKSQGIGRGGGHKQEIR